MNAARALLRFVGTVFVFCLVLVLATRDAAREQRLKRQLGARYEGPAAEDDLP